jgi:hypothetical protein
MWRMSWGRGQWEMVLGSGRGETKRLGYWDGEASERSRWGWREATQRGGREKIELAA